MRIIDHAGPDWEQWRPGVLTRMRASALTGSVQLCVFEQWCDPGCGAPTHLHAVEEQVAPNKPPPTVPRHLVSARTHRLFRAEAFEAWRNAAGVPA
jgi:hypothetical protein